VLYLLERFYCFLALNFLILGPVVMNKANKTGEGYAPSDFYLSSSWAALITAIIMMGELFVKMMKWRRQKKGSCS
jgi:hypothetical protein